MAAPGGTPLEAALQNVAQLETFRLVDDQPHVEAAAATINYVADFDTNFEDRTAFVSGISKYVEEAQSLAALVSGRNRGRGKRESEKKGGKRDKREKKNNLERFILSPLRSSLTVWCEP